MKSLKIDFTDFWPGFDKEDNYFTNLLREGFSVEISPNPDFYSHYNSGKGSVKNPAYGASKAALIAMCNQYSVEFATRLIRFNILTLGGVEGGQDGEFKKKFVSRVPQNRMVDAQEATGALKFLLTAESSYMTGHNLVLDGGYTKW